MLDNGSGEGAYLGCRVRYCHIRYRLCVGCFAAFDGGIEKCEQHGLQQDRVTGTGHEEQFQTPRHA